VTAAKPKLFEGPHFGTGGLVGLQGRRAAPAPRVLLMSCCEKAAGLRDTDLLELNPFPEMSQSQYCR
jgi:hypothetical protein